MFPVNYATVYNMPNEYKPPDETHLSQDTEYPNLNSRDYARSSLGNMIYMHEAWECISISTPETETDGNVAIGCNKLCGREWASSFWGFEKSSVLKSKGEAIKPENACFKLKSSAIMNCMEFVAANRLMVALSNGKLQLWSTYSAVRCAKNPYCLFQIAENWENRKPITCITSFKANENKAASGAQDGAIKVWDMSTADLSLCQSYHFAHTDIITSLTTSPSSDNIFVSCSLDKSCLLWDERETRPSIALYENWNVRLKNVAWSSKDNNLIYIGDESGYVLSLDIRKPKELLNKKEYFDRPIRKIIPNGNNLAVIADSNTIKICECSNHSLLYENSACDNFVRDGAWLSSNELLTVGFDGKMQSHTLKNA